MRLKVGLYAATMLLAVSASTFAGNIVEDWAKVQPPAAPELKKVTLDPKTTALLVLDMVPQTCNAERRPRCLDTITPIHDLLIRARAAKMAVIYSLTTITKESDILPSLKPIEGEPNVSSGPDKFLNTNLDAMLKERGIKTVIMTGTAVNGAIMNTAAQAGLRGYQVVLPEDGFSGNTLYNEQAVVVSLLTGPTLVDRTTLSRGDLIGF
jgi:nicotinamidase-related amidase